MPKCDAVFQGGGVKGIGFAGAVAALETAGYTFENVAGTSAGAIVAALLSVGYTAAEIDRALMETDYTRFREDTFLGKLGLPGKILNLAVFLGVYKTDYFEEWLTGLLARKGKRVFCDIHTVYDDPRYHYKFQAIASDITGRRMLVLPRDLAGFGIDPDSFPIARAVRMSMSIPFYFMPYRLNDRGAIPRLIVDGGLLSNYPIWLLDDGTSEPPWPTFGFKFMDNDRLPDANPAQANDPPGPSGMIRGIADYSAAVVETLLEAHDNREIDTQKGDHKRSVVISTAVHLADGLHKIKATDFDITREESRALYENGARAVKDFLKDWDFREWKRLYRQTQPNAKPAAVR